jgi:DNA-binding transcriptional LysR family regulator
MHTHLRDDHVGWRAQCQERLAAGRLVRLLNGYSGPVRPLHFLFPDGRSQPTKQRVFIDWMTRMLGPQAENQPLTSPRVER